jgi:hypothetical protein
VGKIKNMTLVGWKFACLSMFRKTYIGGAPAYLSHYFEKKRKEEKRIAYKAPFSL